MLNFLTEELLNDPDVYASDVKAPETTLVGTIEKDPPPVSASCLINTNDDILAAHAETSSKRAMFWFVLIMQDKSLWGLADTGSCRNLMSEKFYNSLPLKVDLKPPGSTVVVARNGKSLDLLG